MGRFRARVGIRPASTARSFKTPRVRLLMAGVCLASGLLMASDGRAVPSFGAQDLTGGAALRLRGWVAELCIVQEDNYWIFFNAKLKLKIINEGVDPALLLRQEFVLGAEKLSRTREEAVLGKYLYHSYHWPSVSRAPEWASWRRRLDTASPDPGLIHFMAAGNELEFEKNVTLPIVKHPKGDGSQKSWDEIKTTSPLWLYVVVETWPANLEPNRESQEIAFGNKLRTRWRPLGDLWLTKLTSEPIAIDLSSTFLQKNKCQPAPPS